MQALRSLPRSVRTGSLLVVALALAAAASVQEPDARVFTDDFGLDPADLVATGRNPWFSLEPGYVLRYAGQDATLTITVLDETRRVDGVETRVIEERETEDGELIEVSRNYYALSRRSNDVYYFGEDVDMYAGGQVSGHGGSWLAGRDGARAGLMMPGTPLVGARHYQEIAPGVAMDRAEVLSLSETRTTPAGSFTNVLRIDETTPLEPRERAHKDYARGVGLLRDGELTLVSYGKP